MTPVLKTEGLVKRFGRRKALDGLTLSIPGGTITGLVGSNGAGKTTLFSVVTGILSQDSGTIDLFGEGPFDPELHSGRVALLPQDASLPREASVKGLLEYYAELQGLSREEAGRQIPEIIADVHLTERANDRIRSLSHGMRKRVMIAQALIGEPELILLDEPLNGLDPREVAHMRNILRNRKPGQSMIISSHNLDEIERLCNRVIFMEHGRLVLMSGIRELTGQGHLLRYELKGTPPLDLLRRRMPEAEFEYEEREGLLSCRYSEDMYNEAEVNRVALRALLDEGVDILSVRRGSELESEYLRRSPQRAETGKTDKASSGASTDILPQAGRNR